MPSFEWLKIEVSQFLPHAPAGRQARAKRCGPCFNAPIKDMLDFFVRKFIAKRMSLREIIQLVFSFFTTNLFLDQQKKKTDSGKNSNQVKYTP
jgi:hypothetical protein